MDKTFLKDKIYESMRVDKKEKRRLTENVQARLEQYNDFVQQLTNDDVSLPWDFQRDLEKVEDCIKENNITELEHLKDEYNKLAKEYAASWYDDDLDDWRTGYEWESKFYKKLASLCSPKIDRCYIVKAAVKQELESNFNGVSLVECEVSPYNPHYFDVKVKDATGKSIRFRIPNEYGMTEETASEVVHNAITELIDTGKLMKDVNESLTESLKEEYYPFTFYDEEYNLVPLKTTYNNNGTLAIMVYTDDGEPFGDLTVNLPASDTLADDTHAFVQRDSWVKDFIKQTKIGKPAGKSAKSGFSTFELYEFDINKLDDM